MANDTNICEVHLFSISPNLHHYLTVLNTNAIFLPKIIKIGGNLTQF